MKKLFKFILPIAILAVVLVACAGCGEQKTNLEKLVDRTSYMQEGLYTAADDNSQRDKSRGTFYCRRQSRRYYASLYPHSHASQHRQPFKDV